MKELIKNGKRHAYLYKGNTLIWEKGKNSYTYVRYRGQQITAVNTVNAPISEAVLNGQTLVNLLNYNDSTVALSGKYVQINSMVWDVINKAITVFNYGDKKVRIQTSKNNAYYRQLDFEPNTVTLISLVADEKLERIRGLSAENWTLDETGLNELKTTTMILEGDNTNQYVPYFEGMQSVQAPTVQTVGKNLYNPRTAYLDEANNQFIYNMIDLNPNSMYSFYAKGNVISFELYNDNNQSTGGIDESASLNRINFGTSSKEVKVKLGFYNGTTNGIEDVDFSNVQLQEGSVFTQYEQHKFNQLATSEEVVLRSLPNGVCDTYNTRTKEYVRRIEKVNIKDVSLIFSEMKGEYYRFGAIIQNAKHYQGNAVYCVSDKMLVGKTDTETLQEQLCMYGHSDYVEIRVVLHPSKVNNDSSKIEEYLATNPVMIQYELATPVVTAVQPQITDQNGNPINSLYAFNDTTHIKTGSAALLPTVDIEVPSTVEMFLHNQRKENEGTVYL